ncbi:MAG: DsbA family protein [Candidatus Aenigmatarchaeota archaeon]
MKKYIFVIGIIVIIVGYFLLKPYYAPQPYKEHFLGSENASIIIVEYSDFQCSACRSAYPVVKQVIDTYGNKIKFVYKHFPLTQIHPYAQKAAEASECAADQEKFWEYYTKLFEGTSLSTKTLKNYAKELNLDTDKFDLCLDSGAMYSRVKENFDEGRVLGVEGTPTFFINGEKIVGLIPFSKFKEIIDTKLK